MSVFSEFHKAWRARFPGNDLPAAWEEDVRANLSKHRARVALLKEELEKEQFYVEYLECLLNDVQLQKRNEGDSGEFSSHRVEEEERGQGEGSEGAAPVFPGGVDSAVTQAINTMMVQRRGHPGKGHISPTLDGDEAEAREREPSQGEEAAKTEGAKSAILSDEEDGSPLAPITPLAAAPPSGGSTVKDLARRFTASGMVSPGMGGAGRPPAYNRSTSVPAVSGGPGAKESQFVTVISVNGAGQSEDSRGRKVPPAPPPKTFRRSTGAEGEGDIKIVPSSPGLSRPPHAAPRSPQRPRHPSPVRDSQSTPTKSPLQKTLSASSDGRPSSGKEPHRSPQPGRDLQKSPSNSKELQKSPSSASSSTGSLGKKCVSKSSSSASSSAGSGAPSRRVGLSKTSSLSSSRCGEDEDEVGGGSASGASLENLTDDEPLYDTVAPDEDEDTGEYVLLSDKSSEYNGTDTLKSAASGASSEGGLSKSGGGASSGATPSGGSPAPDHPPDSPKYSNYVNIDFFLKKKKARGRPVQRSDSVESDEDEVPNLLRSISSDHEDEVRDEALDIDSDTMASACVQDGGQLDMENLHVDSDLASLMKSCLSTMVEALSESKDGREDGEGGITEGQEERNEGGNEARKRLSEVEGEGEEQSDGDDDTSACNDIFDEPWERETMMRVISQLTVMSSPPPSPSPSPISGPAHVGVYGSSVESTSHMPSAPPTPPTAARWASADLPEQPKSSPAAEAERMTMYRCIISSIVESETIYLECLDVVLQYMKALKATLTTSQPVISPDDFSTVFYRIGELHAAHSAFLQGLRDRSSQLDGSGTIGELFRDLASKLDVYASFLQNYPRAIETVRRCSSQSPQFADITRSIKLRSLQGQPQSLEDLLHRPVARVQKNALVLHDLLKYTSEAHPDHETLKEALKLTQNFLTHLSMIHTEAMFPAQDRPQRHLVRNSFIVELVEGHRKLRHLFLFNDVIVCAKYKVSGPPTGRSEKFTFEVKWYISLHDIAVLNDSGPETLKESNPPNLVSLKSQASTIRDQLRRIDNMGEKGATRMNQARNEKHRKKLAELEAQLVLASPNLPFRISKRAGPVHTFLLTSEYERDQWGEAIQVLQANTPGVGGSSLTLHELQGWITAYRSFLKTNMGSFLLKSGRDDSLLLGDLHIVVSSLHGLTRPAKMFVCFEVDSYGHFFRKVKTKQADGVEPHWNQDFIIELEGSQTLRILCYEEDPKLGVQLRGKAHLELSRSWLSDTLNERRVSLQDLVLVLSLKFLPPEATLRRVPTGKSSGLFGTNIANVCKREKRSVPFIVTRCVREVERRGMQEVGIYRVSGLASDITKLKKSFESNPYEAEQLVKEVDIHSVTGLLKLFLRELPEALFTDELYPRFFEAYSAADPEYRKTTILKLFSSLPQLNQSIIAYLLEHLVKVHQIEHQNKMSLHNLATVFGPTLIRPGAKAGNPSPAEQLAAGTVDVMAQAGILHFFLTRRAHGEPIQGVNQ
ncbi:breakpoint cluster region protein-like isoform X3 [Penaeus japonicus]|uniref:breakpoint cluster region protein-like isoform X3 n=1 Tax=Penaeus japonicus TaxID=27405 RepID=UPI001C70CF41|nr:breakpoint cluster region protein-like isoform X3 [Penaeus japonicus]